MADSSEDWKQRHIDNVSASIDFFSTENKFERESWVVRRLLLGCGIQFEESELLPALEPSDVAFRDAKFQVKEIIERGRRRGDEYRNALADISRANTESDLLQSSSRETISLSKVAEIVVVRANALAETKYGPKECAAIDLLFYFNFIDVTITSPEDISKNLSTFRSVSLVSNTYCAVIYAATTAPDFLRQGVYENGQTVVPNAV